MNVTPINQQAENHMKASEVQDVTFEQMVTNLCKPGGMLLAGMTPEKMHILHMAVGLSGEAAELLEIYFDADESGLMVDLTDIREELGDIEFYLEGLRQGLGFSCPVPFDASSNNAITEISVLAGHILDACKRHCIYNKPLETERLWEVLTQVEVVLASIRSKLDLSREEILQANAEKLLKGKKARYASGTYSDEAAINRADKQEGSNA